MASDSGEGRVDPSARGLGAGGGPGRLAAQLSHFARAVQQENDPHATLAEITRAAVELIPGCAGGSISVVHARRRVQSEAASGELSRAVDAVQDEVGQGPCLDAVFEHETVSVPDMAAEDRWPLFATRACALGARSMLSFQLYVQGDNLGALNLYGTEPYAFTAESEDVGTLFASHAAIAYASAQQLSELESKAETRHLIGQAQGILMERHKVDTDQAFRMLVRVSQAENVKLREIARRLVYSGEVRGGLAGT